MVKEAVHEAKEKENLQEVVKLGDIKAAARESGSKKWQMWEKSDCGRNLFRFRPRVDYKLKHSFDTRLGEKIVTQLRTGYIRLNEYMKKGNLGQSDKSQCGEVEPVVNMKMRESK